MRPLVRITALSFVCLLLVCPEWSSIWCSSHALESQQEGAFKNMKNWCEDTETSSACVKAPSREDTFEFMETYGLPATVGLE